MLIEYTIRFEEGGVTIAQRVEADETNGQMGVAPQSEAGTGGSDPRLHEVPPTHGGSAAPGSQVPIVILGAIVIGAGSVYTSGANSQSSGETGNRVISSGKLGEKHPAARTGRSARKR